jgi:hypothetical protein
MPMEGILMSIRMTAATFGLAATFLAACGVKTKTTELAGGGNRAATCEAVIVGYDSRADIPSDYYEVGFIEAEANSVYTTDKKVNDQIRKRAAQMGATAIIVNPVSEAKQGVKVLGEALGANSATSKASALAIYIPAQADRVTQLCGR